MRVLINIWSLKTELVICSRIGFLCIIIFMVFWTFLTVTPEKWSICPQEACCAGVEWSCKGTGDWTEMLSDQWGGRDVLLEMETPVGYFIR